MNNVDIRQSDWTDRADKKIGEQHTYARLTFQIMVSWFTVFITINYASMGWLAAAQHKPDSGLIHLVAYLFASQNALGIAACLVAKHALTKANRQIESYEKIAIVSKTDTGDRWPNDVCMPLSFYSNALWLMISAISLILIAWILFPQFVITGPSKPK